MIEHLSGRLLARLCCIKFTVLNRATGAMVWHMIRICLVLLFEKSYLHAQITLCSHLNFIEKDALLSKNILDLDIGLRKHGLLFLVAATPT